MRSQARAWAKGIRTDLQLDGAVSGDDIANEAGYQVVERELQPGILGQALDPNTIFITPGIPPSKRQHVIGHEFSELWAPPGIAQEVEQRFHDLVSAELRLPPHDFIAAIKEHGLNILTLQFRFIHCSLEDICRRFPSVVRNCFAASWEGHSEHPRWRESADGATLTDAARRVEREALGYAYYGRMGEAGVVRDGYGRAEAPGIVAHAWRTSEVNPNRGLTVVFVDPQAL